jgi:hypothetical protein
MILSTIVLAPLVLAAIPLVLTVINFSSGRLMPKMLINEGRFRGLFCFALTTIVVTPLVLAVIDFSSGWLMGKNINEPELSGVSTIPPRPVISVNALLSGKFQSDFEEYFTYHLPARKTYTRTYNQLLYSLFRSTDQAGFLVGRSNYIYESAYPDAYLTEVPSWLMPELTKKINELAELNHLLKKRGIVLVVRISPTKAQHYPEYLPSGYRRFVEMKQEGQYGPNWYEAFKQEVAKTDIPVYDRYDLFEQMKRDGHIVFTKGGTHWSKYPLAEYINGLNAYLEGQLGKKLGRITVTSSEEKFGQMGIPADRDIWDICWNALSAEPNYSSPNISFGTTPGEFKPRVFTVGQSFTTVLLDAIYNNIRDPIWSETLFSWYDSYVLRYPNSANLPWGERIAEKTNEYDKYLNMDVIMIEFLESSAYPPATQFKFVSDLLNYLKTGAK